jgi:hypothetical protein
MIQRGFPGPVAAVARGAWAVLGQFSARRTAIVRA